MAILPGLMAIRIGLMAISSIFVAFLHVLVAIRTDLMAIASIFVAFLHVLVAISPRLTHDFGHSISDSHRLPAIPGVLSAILTGYPRFHALTKKK